MKVLLQRVQTARVDVDAETVGQIDRGLLLFVGVAADDGDAEIDWLVEKIAGLRIFADQDGAMNLSVVDVAGACLIVSQFTLMADTRKGKRPSFTAAAPPEEANALYQQFAEQMAQHVPVQTGRFGADMQVHLINDGPVTLWLER